MRVHWWRVGLVVLLVCAAGMGVAGWQLAKLIHGMCRTQPGASSVSPDGRWRAVVYQYDCGTTTAAATHVSVVPREKGDPRGPGNVLTAAQGDGLMRPGVVGGPRVTVIWTGADRLRVVRPPYTRVFSAETRVGKVTVTHVVTAK